MFCLQNKRWSPFFVGALIGLLTVGSNFLFGSFIGVSSVFVKLMMIIGSLFDSDFIQKSEYFATFVNHKAEMFQLLMALGIIVGAFLSSIFSKSFVITKVPEVWKQNFGASFVLRSIVAFFGGAILIFGARLAGGCTSGKAIASGLQLLIPAWIFVATLFLTGIIVSFVLYRK